MAVHMCQVLCVDVEIFKRTGPSLHFIFKRRTTREKKEPLKKYKDNKKTQKLDFT